MRGAVATIVDPGLVGADRAAAALPADSLDDPLLDYGDTEAEAVTTLLVDLEVGFEVHSDDVLAFRRNGEPVEWPVSHASDEYLDQMSFFQYVDQFTSAASPRRWASIEIDGGQVLNRYVFAEPAALHALGERFGITFEVYPD